MNYKTIKYSESIDKTEDGLASWKSLYDIENNRRMYGEFNCFNQIRVSV